MKRLAILFLLCVSSAMAQGIRFDSTVTQEGTIGTVTNAVLIPAAPQIAFCNFPANAVPCTNKATTYTTNTLVTPCSTSTQIVLTGTTSCVASPDAQGNWGVWAAAGQYAYTITLPGGVNLGPYDITMGIPSGANLSLGSLTVAGALNANGTTTLANLNNELYASQCAGANAEAKVAACAALLSSGGTVYIDFVGAQSWPATLTVTTGINYLFKNCATYDATSLTSSPFLSSTSQGGSWNFIGAGAGKGGVLGNGCTVFKVANTSAQNINIIDQQQINLGNFSIVRSSGTGGDIIDAAYLQNYFIHDLFAFPISNGAKWSQGYALNEDANGSSIYNIVQNVGVLPFSGAVGGLTTACLHLTGATGGKVVNQNIFTQIICGGHGSGVTGLVVDGGSLQANENRIVGDFSANQTCFTIAATSARDLDLSGSTCENSIGSAYTINSGNTYFRCSNCEVAGNSSQGTDSGTNSYWQGNVGNGTQQNYGLTWQGDILINGMCGGAVAFTDASCAGAFNMPADWLFQNAGTSLAQMRAGGWSFTRQNQWDEIAAPGGAAGEDVVWGDSAAHRLKMNNNNGGIDFVVGDATVDTFTAAKTFGAGSTLNFTNLLASPTAPTIAAGGCGGTVAAIQNANGTASFEIFTGTAPTSAGCTVTFPAAAHHWICPTITHTSAVSTTNFIILQTGALSSTSVTFQLFSDVAAATAPAASDTWAVSGCHAN